MEAASFEFIRDVVYKRAAIVLEPGKEYLVENRLSPIIKSAGLGTMEGLVAKLRRDAKELETAVVEAMTTNETSFFRDIHPFEAFKKVLPAVVKARSASRTLRIWCAAASTGQEPLSIAMILREGFPQLDDWNVKIVATDINESVLSRARSGLFKQLEVNRGMPAHLLTRFFERSGVEWKAKPTIQSMVHYTKLNLLDRFTMLGPQDFVFMRNVLIYFDLATKREILRKTRELLGPEGWLVLGGAETTLNLDDQFMPTKVGQTVLYQKKP